MLGRNRESKSHPPPLLSTSMIQNHYPQPFSSLSRFHGARPTSPAPCPHPAVDIPPMPVFDFYSRKHIICDDVARLQSDLILDRKTGKWKTTTKRNIAAHKAWLDVLKREEVDISLEADHFLRTLPYLEGPLAFVAEVSLRAREWYGKAKLSGRTHVIMAVDEEGVIGHASIQTAENTLLNMGLRRIHGAALSHAQSLEKSCYGEEAWNHIPTACKAKKVHKMVRILIGPLNDPENIPVGPESVPPETPSRKQRRNWCWMHRVERWTELSSGPIHDPVIVDELETGDVNQRHRESSRRKNEFERNQVSSCQPPSTKCSRYEQPDVVYVLLHVES